MENRQTFHTEGLRITYVGTPPSSLWGLTLHTLRVACVHGLPSKGAVWKGEGRGTLRWETCQTLAQPGGQG